MGNLKNNHMESSLDPFKQLKKVFPFSHSHLWKPRLFIHHTHEKKDLLLAGVSLYNPHQRDSDQRLSH